MQPQRAPDDGAVAAMRQRVRRGAAGALVKRVVQDEFVSQVGLGQAGTRQRRARTYQRPGGGPAARVSLDASTAMGFSLSDDHLGLASSGPPVSANIGSREVGVLWEQRLYPNVSDEC